MPNALPQSRRSMALPLIHLTLFITLFFQMASTQAQTFPGFSSGNYSGVNGVYSNPANVAGSRYRWDVNLFSFGLGFGNNNASFSMKDLSGSFNGDSLKNKVAGKNAGLTSGALNVDIHGPSFMFNIGKNGFAITTRARVMVNMKNIDGQLVNQFLNTNDNSSLPYNFSTTSDNIINVNAWKEIGLSFGRVLMQKGPNYFKGGITLKYLSGFGNGYLQMDKVQGTVDQDLNGPYLTQTTGRAALGFGGAHIDNITLSDISTSNGSGIGGDIGFVYEFRPGRKGYKFKIGVALLDIGSISYKKDTSRTGAYTANITGGQKAYVSDFGKLEDFKQYFEAHPQFFIPASGNNLGSYSVSLPTTMQLELDYHMIKGLYLNMAGQFSLAGTSESKPYNSNYYSAFTLTPRFEGRHFGFYLPLNYNGLTHFNAGYCIRFGPVFMGSASMLSALFGNSKQLDMFFGVRFGGLK